MIETSQIQFLIHQEHTKTIKALSRRAPRGLLCTWNCRYEQIKLTITGLLEDYNEVKIADWQIECLLLSRITVFLCTLALAVAGWSAYLADRAESVR